MPYFVFRVASVLEENAHIMYRISHLVVRIHFAVLFSICFRHVHTIVVFLSVALRCVLYVRFTCCDYWTDLGGVILWTNWSAMRYVCLRV